MSDNLSVGGSPILPDLTKLQSAKESSSAGETLNSVFPVVSALVVNGSSQSGIDSQKSLSNPKPKAPFKTDMAAFSKLNLDDNAIPQKEINGMKFYSTGGKEEIKTAKINGEMVISLGDTGQKIRVPLGQMQPKGATVVYNAGKLAVKGLKDATVTGLRDGEIKDSDVNNQILAKDCNGCTFDLNDKSNGLKESRDDLVMENCKSAKVLTGQNNTIVGISGTSADVSYSSVVGKKAYDNPLSDWINKYHTNMAYDDTSTLTSSNKGTVNRDAHDPLIRDIVKTQGATAAENSFQTKDGTFLKAADFLLNVINQDSADSDNGSKSAFNARLESKAPKMSIDTLLAQVNKITNNQI